MQEINEYLVVRTADLQTAETEGEEFILITQRGRTRNATIEDVRHVAVNLDDEDSTKSASNLNLRKEYERATNSEGELTDNLNTEIQRAEQSESNITIKINEEIERAIHSENVINNIIIAESDKARSAEKILDDKINIETERASNSENTITNNLNSEITRAKAAENTITNTINTNKPAWDDKYTKNEVDNKISAVVTALDYKEHVTIFADLSTTYPNPQEGWTVSVDHDDITYKYNGIEWSPISANSIPLATSSVDGKMSKQDKIDHDDMNSKKHTHINKGILDVITQSLFDTWNSAYSHISDTIKHITNVERTNWNTVNNKANINHTHDDRYYTETESDNKFATKGEISQAGYGDMMKSVYDTNEDGVVDNADKLDGKHASDFAYSTTGNSDLNTIIQSGMYRINGSLSNAPAGVEWGQLLVIHGGADTITQIVTDYSSNLMCWRSGNPTSVGGKGNWCSWRNIWHDGNFNPSTKSDTNHNHDSAYLKKQSLTWGDLIGL